jgi:hypothetical protein
MWTCQITLDQRSLARRLQRICLHHTAIRIISEVNRAKVVRQRTTRRIIVAVGKADAKPGQVWLSWQIESNFGEAEIEHDAASQV